LVCPRSRRRALRCRWRSQHHTAGAGGSGRCTARSRSYTWTRISTPADRRSGASARERLPMPTAHSSIRWRRSTSRFLRRLTGVRVVGMDLVEVVPALDHDDATANPAAHLVFTGWACSRFRAAEAETLVRDIRRISPACSTERGSARFRVTRISARRKLLVTGASRCDR
jgi:hypothetical protein